MIGGTGRAAFSTLGARLYERFVARGQERLYDQLAAEILRDVAPAARSDDGVGIVDVGCGPGHTALALRRRRPGSRIVGVDASGEMVRLARARLSGSERGGRDTPRFVRADALALPLPDARFDVACSVASLKHWPDRARGLAEMVRVLVPGGRAVVIEADRAASRSTLHAYARRWPWLPPLALEIAFRGFIASGSVDEAEARRLLDSSGLVGTRISRLEGTPLLVLRGDKPASEERG